MTAKRLPLPNLSFLSRSPRSGAPVVTEPWKRLRLTSTKQPMYQARNLCRT